MPNAYLRPSRCNGKAVWTVRWHDEHGKRRSTSLPQLPPKKCYRKDAERWGEEAEARAFRIRQGWIDPDAEAKEEIASTKFAEHAKAYIEHCRHVGMCRKSVAMKRKTLDDLRAESGIVYLRAFNRRAVDHYLQCRRRKKKSARTVNRERADILAFANWLRATNRIADHNLDGIPKLNEETDRRRVYRPFTEEEAAWLLKVTKERSERRYMTYLIALWTGLRWGEIRQLKWSDVDLEEGCVTVPAAVGKNRKQQSVPIHFQLLEALRSWRDRSAGPRVLPEMSTRAGFLADLDEARTAWLNDGDPTPAELERREKLPTLKQHDPEGRVLTFHSFRATTATMLARAGVAPQIVKRIMRHANIETTLKHYTHLTLRDDAAALDTLSDVSIGGNLIDERATA